MNIYVKLTGKTTETLQSVFGVNSGTLDLGKGLLRVNDPAIVDVLAEKQMIDNVNNQTYEKFKQAIAKAAEEASKAPENVTVTKEDNADAGEEQPVELTADERNKIIGWKPTVGSIIRTGEKGAIEHMVILAISDDQFTTATLQLKGKALTDSVPLKKGVDVLYKNPTYKERVTVTKEITYGVTADQFRKGAGGTIVGKVIKLDKIQGLIDYALQADGSENEDPVEA